MEQALKTALSVQEAEKQERFNESFTHVLKIRLDWCHVRLRERVAKAVSEDAPLIQRTQPVAHVVSVILRSVAKNEQRQILGSRGPLEMVRCYECKGIGHFSRDCSTRLRRESYP